MINGKLKNNIPYIISHNNSYSSVTIIVLFKVGSRNEPLKYYGISHYIEHMLFKGTNKRKKPEDIVNILYRYGAKVNAFTDRDSTGYFVKIIPEKLEIAMDILSDMIFNSKFADKDLKMEKKVVLNELERFTSDPEKQIHQMNADLLYNGTTLQHDIGGTKEDIMKYSKNMVMSYLQNFYSCNNMLITIAGNIIDDEKNIIKKLEKYFGHHKFHYKPHIKDIKNKKNLIHSNLIKYYPDFYNLQNGIRFNHIVRKDLKQAYVIISIPTFGINDDRSFIVDIIGIILAGNMGSRLFLKMREKYGLVYTVRKDIDKYEDIGSLKIQFSTFNDVNIIKKCCEIVINEFLFLSKNKISKKELAYAIDYSIGSIKLSREDTKSVALFYGYNQLFMGDPFSYDYFIKKYKLIDRNDILNISKEIFQKNKLNISVISKENSLL